MPSAKLNTVVIRQAFDGRLNYDALVVLLLLAITAVAFNVVKTKQFRRSVWENKTDNVTLQDLPDKATLGRDKIVRFKNTLRLGFACLWILDGILQMQSSMPFGLPTSVIKPAESGSPQWVTYLVNHALILWERHPITYATGVAWIQLGIGLLILLAPSGLTLRLAGALSALWGFGVWVFGEAFGAIFAPHPSWLLGTPGAALLYVAGGILLFLPDIYFYQIKHQKLLYRLTGIYFLVMLILQIWPANGYWNSKNGSAPGYLADQVHQSALMSQPRWITDLLNSFSDLLLHDALAINLIIVLILAFTSFAFLSGYKNVCRYALIIQTALSVAVWILFQDFGFLGGVGTDPNSMIPTLILMYGVYFINKENLAAFDLKSFFAAVAFVGREILKKPSPRPLRVPAIDQTPRITDQDYLSGDQGLPTGWAKTKDYKKPDFLNMTGTDTETTDAREMDGVKKGFLQNLLAKFKSKPLTTQLRLFVSLESMLIIAMGAIPMSISAFNGTVSPIVDEAYNGLPNNVGGNASNFTLINTDGQKVSLSAYKNKIVFLVFLDPVCTSDCPLIAQEIKRADETLGHKRKFVEFIAIDANPLYTAVSYTKAFNSQEEMTGLGNWQYLTANLKTLNRLWGDYGVSVSYAPAGAMTVHSEIAYLIGKGNKIKEIINDSPRTNNLLQTSFVNVIDNAINNYIANG